MLGKRKIRTGTHVILPALGAALLAILLIQVNEVPASSASATTTCYYYYGGELVVPKNYSGIERYIQRDSALLHTYTAGHHFIAYLNVGDHGTHDCVTYGGKRTCHLQVGLGFGTVGNSGKTTSVKPYSEAWGALGYYAFWYTLPLATDSFNTAYWNGHTLTIKWTGTYQQFGQFYGYIVDKNGTLEFLTQTYLNYYGFERITAVDELETLGHGCPTLNHTDKFGTNGASTYGTAYYLEYYQYKTKAWTPFSTTPTTYVTHTTSGHLGTTYPWHDLNNHRAFYVSG